MRKSNTNPSSVVPVFRRMGDTLATWPTVEGRPEAQVMLLLMQAAAEVVGPRAACDIWNRAAEASLYDHPNSFRRAWCQARAPFGNHAPSAIEWKPEA